jgi:hypothetical protein
VLAAVDLDAVLQRLGDPLLDRRIGLQHQEPRPVGDELDLGALAADAVAQVGHVVEDQVPARRVVVGDLEQRPVLRRLRLRGSGQGEGDERRGAGGDEGASGRGHGGFLDDVEEGGR